MFKIQTKQFTRPTTTLLLCMTLLALAACEKNHDSDGKNIAASAAASQPATAFEFQPQIEEIQSTAPNCEGESCAQVSLQRLHSNVPALDRAIDLFTQSYIKSQVDGYDLDDADEAQGSTDQAASTAQSNPASASDSSSNLQPDLDKFYRIAAEVKSMGSAAQFSLEVKPEVISHHAPILSVVVHASNYTGGAHGSSTDQYFNYDVKKGSILNLSDVILADQRKVFNDLAYHAYQAWIKSTQPDMNLKDYQELWPFRMTDNFSLSPQGLVLYYNEYDIGAYSLGRPHLLIPYQNLVGVVRPRFLPESIQSQPHHQPVNNNR